MVESKKKKYIYWIVLVVIIALQGVRMIYNFAYEKGDKHSDEIWAFGLANSSNGPHIFLNDEGEAYVNEWVDASVFRDYITVSDEERFSYGNVIHNLKYDTAPPLYCLVLHTVCSFFPNTYSAWYGFWIGFVCFLITQVVLYLLAVELFRSRFWGVLTVALYGFTIGALDIVVFVRHYSMLVMFTVVFLYTHLKLLRTKEGKGFTKWIIATGISLFCGSMTHYFFVVFAFGICLGYFGWYAFHKNIKSLICYTSVMFSGVLATIPFTSLSNVLGMGGGEVSQEVNEKASAVLQSSAFGDFFSKISEILNYVYSPKFEEEANIVLSCFTRDLFGIDSNISIPYLLWFLLVMGIYLFIVLVLLSVYVVKKENPLKETKVVHKLKAFYQRLSNIGEKHFYIYVCIIAIVLESYIVILYGQPLVMHWATDRYLFLTYPLVIMLFVVFMRKMLAIMAKKIQMTSCVQYLVAGGVALAVLIGNNLGTEARYLFPRIEGAVNLSEVTKDKDVILSLGLHWRMTCYLDHLMNANRIFVTDDSAIYDEEDLLRDTSTESFIIIQDVDNFKRVQSLRHNIDYTEVTREMVESQYMKVYEDVYCDKKIEYVGEDTIFQRTVYVYKVY